MKWSMDTHKYISNITRTALQVLVEYDITSESQPEEIKAAEKELARVGVYRNYESADGRIRRALLTYFKAYGCLDNNDRLTEVGSLYCENRISIREFSFYYIANYYYEDEESKYYPTHLILSCIQKLRDINQEQAFLTPYDFSKIVECNGIDDISEEFIDGLIEARNSERVEVNERNIGFDVWAKMLIQAGILKRDAKRNLIVSNNEMINWMLYAYEQNPTVEMGKISTGIFNHIPIPSLSSVNKEGPTCLDEGSAAQAFLFDGVDDYLIDKYIFSCNESTFIEFKKQLGLEKDNLRGYYSMFVGLERLIGFVLCRNPFAELRLIGRIIASVEAKVEEDDIIQEDLITGGSNILLYGVPGSGKSHTIDSIVENSEYERVVFHPDYSYSDFVGQIMPRLKRNADGTEKLTYEFVPGPFTKALKAAVKNKDSMHYLVIEEINRGNAPAIFGDVFQLLDRNEDGSGKYHITNFDIGREVYDGDENAPISIPSNLSILATMNTSDQNVFTLDTAFQRRWNMKYIENNVAEAEHANEKIEYSNVTWGGFASAVNEEILEYNAELSSSEDKQLGAYFVTKAELTSDKFPEKALKYLWDDAFKLEREKIFRPEIKSVGDLVHSYDVEIQNDRDPIKGVMRAEVYRKMMDMSASGPEEAIDESEIFEAEINDGE